MGSVEDPRRAAGALNGEELELLHTNVRTILAEAIASAGTTFRDYRAVNGRSGSFQTSLDVYGKEGSPCRRCGPASTSGGRRAPASTRASPGCARAPDARRPEALGLQHSWSMSTLPGPDPGSPWGAPPQENDVFVFAFGEREGEIITPDDLSTDAQQVFAYPMDPTTGVVRNGSRLNQVLLVRLDGARLSESSRARSAGDVVAYSAVCTHTGCDVADWDDDTLQATRR